MTISWPSDIIPNSIVETLIQPEAVTESPYSGGTQSNSSASHLFEFTFGFPPLTVAQMETCKAAIFKAGQDDVLMPIYRPHQALATSGTITCRSAALNKTIYAQAVNSAYAPKSGRFFSILTGGRYYLYNLAADSSGGSTNRDFTSTGSIRVAHTTNDPIYFEPPYIQGRISSNSRQVQADEDGLYRGLSITIRETK